MANQPGIKVLLDKLKPQIEAFQRVVMMPLLGKGRSPGHGTETNKESSQVAYTGPQLEIGDELLITADIVSVYRDLSNALGRVVIIDQITSKADEAIRASAFGIQVYVNMQMAGQMRAAYLQREQS
ncbi:MAG: hypothetical protein KJ065_02895 [Anaerolineae bacterium]|nr:hypothetical protein [Anaerolineae bacterium]